MPLQDIRDNRAVKSRVRFGSFATSFQKSFIASSQHFRLPLKKILQTFFPIDYDSLISCAFSFGSTTPSRANDRDVVLRESRP